MLNFQFPDLAQVIFGDPSFRLFFFAFKTVFLMLNAALVIGLIYVFRKSWQFRSFLSSEEVSIKHSSSAKNPIFIKRWSEIEKKAATGLPEAVKIAIIEADKLVDDVLKKFGIAGEHMADRLENLPTDEMRNLDALWRSHRLRNNIVHAPGFEVSSAEAKHALKNYKAFLEELGIL